MIERTGERVTGGPEADGLRAGGIGDRAVRFREIRSHGQRRSRSQRVVMREAVVADFDLFRLRGLERRPRRLILQIFSHHKQGRRNR